MHNVIPLAQVSRQAIRDMAEAAVSNGVPVTEANPFEPGTASHGHFNDDFQDFSRELAAVA